MWSLVQVSSEMSQEVCYLAYSSCLKFTFSSPRAHSTTALPSSTLCASALTRTERLEAVCRHDLETRWSAASSANSFGDAPIQRDTQSANSNIVFMKQWKKKEPGGNSLISAIGSRRIRLSGIDRATSTRECSTETLLTFLQLGWGWCCGDEGGVGGQEGK